MKSDRSINRTQDHARRWTGRLYVRVARALPRFRTSWIAELQQAIELADLDFERNRERLATPPEARLGYRGFVLFELFESVAYDELKDQLLRLFPTLRDDRFSDFHENYERNVRNEVAGSWSHIGVIQRPRGRFFMAMRDRAVMDALPEEVEYIDVELHKIFSGSLVLIFLVRLGETDDSQVDRITGEATLEFRRLFPPWKAARSFRHVLPEDLAQANVRARREELKGKVREQLRRFCGFYAASCPRLGIELPSVEVLAFRLPAVIGDGTLRSWYDEHRDWCRAQWLGFDGFPFISDHLVWATRHDHRSRPLLQTFVLLESAFSEDAVTNYGSLESAVWEGAVNSFREFASIIVVDTLLSVIAADVALNSLAARRLMAHGRRSLAAHLRARRPILADADRLASLELDFGRESFLMGNMSAAVQNLRRWSIRGDAVEPREPVDGNGIATFFESKRERLASAARVARETTNDALALLNVDLTFGLQRRLLRLTIIVAVVAIAATLLAGYDNVGRFVCERIQHLPAAACRPH